MRRSPLGCGLHETSFSPIVSPLAWSSFHSDADKLTPVANRYWAPGHASYAAYDPKVIEDLYYRELIDTSVGSSRVVMLELSSYLEKYVYYRCDWIDCSKCYHIGISVLCVSTLQPHSCSILPTPIPVPPSHFPSSYLWKNFDPDTATYAHVMSIIILINEKFRENLLGIWDSLVEVRSAPVLTGFFRRAFALKDPSSPYAYGTTAAAPAATALSSSSSVTSEAAAAVEKKEEEEEHADDSKKGKKSGKSKGAEKKAKGKGNKSASTSEPMSDVTETDGAVSSAASSSTSLGPRFPNMRAAEQVHFVKFLLHSFSSLEHPVVRPAVMRLASLPIWRSLTESTLKDQLLQYPDFAGPWRKLQKQDPSRTATETTFLPNILLEFFTVLDAVGVDTLRLKQGLPLLPRSSGPSGASPEASAPVSTSSLLRELRGNVSYVEHVVDLFIDMCSQVATRKFVRPLLQDVHFAARCRLSLFGRHGSPMSKSQSRNAQAVAAEAAAAAATKRLSVLELESDTESSSSSAAGSADEEDGDASESSSSSDESASASGSEDDSSSSPSSSEEETEQKRKTAKKSNATSTSKSAQKTVGKVTAQRRTERALRQHHRQQPSYLGLSLSNNLFLQLLDMLQFYLDFEIDPQTGLALSDRDITVEHLARLQRLQRTAFKTMPSQLEELIVATTGSLGSRSALTTHLGVLSTEQLEDLAKSVGLEVDRSVITGVRDDKELVWSPITTGATDLQSSLSSNGNGDVDVDVDDESKAPQLIATSEARKALALDVLVSYHAKRPSVRQAVQSMSLYPTEDLMWDEKQVPSNDYTGKGCLALPKLNVQFLTLYDYLLRNFNLYRLESAYEIREDLVQTIQRMRPVYGPSGGVGGYVGATRSSGITFTGRSYTGLPMTDFEIKFVKPAEIGQTVPAKVRAHVTVDVGGLPPAVRDEWDLARTQDVMFLVTLRAPAATAQYGQDSSSTSTSSTTTSLTYSSSLPSAGGAVPGVKRGREPSATDSAADTAASGNNNNNNRNNHGKGGPGGRGGPRHSSRSSNQRGSISNKATARALGITYVRGCEVQRVLDRTGKAIGERDEVTGHVHTAQGTLRTYVVNLDPAQYQKDMVNVVENADQEDVYTTFNVLVRRKAEENTFKAVLSTIRDLMLSETWVPDWLRDVFLGFGNPAAAAYYNLPNEMDQIRFADTFLDSEHVTDSFVQSVQFRDPVTPLTDSNGVVRMPQNAPPYAITFPRGVRADVTALQQRLSSLIHKYSSRVPTYVPVVKVDELPVFLAARVPLAAFDVDKNAISSTSTSDTSNAASTSTSTSTTMVDTTSSSSISTSTNSISTNSSSTITSTNGSSESDAKAGVIVAEPYQPVQLRDTEPRRNAVRFTPVQVEAIRAGVNPGLTLIVGPPGTGKTDTAVQILSELYHNLPKERVLLVTHSNQALNDLFRKLMERDVDERYLLRLGHGHEDLETEKDFSKFGRVNYMLERRLNLLGEVSRLGQSMGLGDDVGYTCETAGLFYTQHVLHAWQALMKKVDELAGKDVAAAWNMLKTEFPFTKYFANVNASSSSSSTDSLFTGSSFQQDRDIAQSCFEKLRVVFGHLDETRPFELLRKFKDRGDFLLTQHARIIAMTCTHAAMRRPEFLKLGLRYDTLVMEEAGQVLDIETFIPMVLQDIDAEFGNRLKRVIMLGDHNQLPPVIQNRAFQKYSRMDQSLFARLVRLGLPVVQLNAQGRMRPELAQLWNWRYQNLQDLPLVNSDARFSRANCGFAHEFQLVDVDDWDGERCPQPHFYQNVAEAEYVVHTFMYMRIMGIPASKISIITTYNGQKALINDVLNARCAHHPLLGLPAVVATVDKFQGQQNDYILLSLVRTSNVGHVRDVRRLVVAMSRARLGLYVFGRASLFQNTFELARTFAVLLTKPTKLQLCPMERNVYGVTDRPSAMTAVAQGLSPYAYLKAPVTAATTSTPAPAAASEATTTVAATEETSTGAMGDVDKESNKEASAAQEEVNKDTDKSKSKSKRTRGKQSNNEKQAGDEDEKNVEAVADADADAAKPSEGGKSDAQSSSSSSSSSTPTVDENRRVEAFTVENLAHFGSIVENLKKVRICMTCIGSMLSLFFLVPYSIHQSVQGGSSPTLTLLTFLLHLPSHLFSSRNKSTKPTLPITSAWKQKRVWSASARSSAAERPEPRRRP